MPNFEQNLPLEEIVDEGRGVLIRNKTLFHGSSVAGIDRLKTAEESTVGNGVYFTSRFEDAQGYAVRRSRSREGSEPVIYSTNIDNLKFFDARNNDNVSNLLTEFLPLLIGERQKEGLPWMIEATLDEAIKKIRDSKVNAGNLREVTFAHGKLFTDYLKSLGYDGLIAVEGGEGDDIGNHDTYVVFDPSKIQTLSIENKQKL